MSSSFELSSLVCLNPTPPCSPCLGCQPVGCCFISEKDQAPWSLGNARPGSSLAGGGVGWQVLEEKRIGPPGPGHTSQQGQVAGAWWLQHGRLRPVPADPALLWPVQNLATDSSQLAHPAAAAVARCLKLLGPLWQPGGSGNSSSRGSALLFWD